MTDKRKIGGVLYVKADGLQLSVNSLLELPINTVILEDIVGADGSVHYKETHKAPYIKAEFKVERSFPIQKLTSADEMTITAKLANGMVYVLSGAWLSGKSTYNPLEGTIEMEFHETKDFINE